MFSSYYFLLLPRTNPHTTHHSGNPHTTHHSGNPLPDKQLHRTSLNNF